MPNVHTAHRSRIARRECWVPPNCLLGRRLAVSRGKTNECVETDARCASLKGRGSERRSAPSSCTSVDTILGRACEQPVFTPFPQAASRRSRHAAVGITPDDLEEHLPRKRSDPFQQLKRPASFLLADTKFEKTTAANALWTTLVEETL